VPHWQRCDHATDSQAEQSLEVGVQSADARRREHLATGFPGARRRVRRNGKGATAVVTRCGCQRGEFFEGYETRRGKGGAPAHRQRWGGAGAEKRGEPQDRQRDATSPRLHGPSASARRSGRRKPSRRCETARTEHDVQVGKPGPEVGMAARSDRREWTPGKHVDGGGHETHERRPNHRPGR
jgi:hypothetical protein